jgi:hypothetical protein
MTPKGTDDTQSRGKDLEDEFFRREDQKLLERLRAEKAAKGAREALTRATGIENPAVLDKLAELGIRPETVTALSIVPLVEVAWADGSLDAKERKTVLEHAREHGVAPGSPEDALLAAWLERRPEPRLLTAWTHLVGGMCERLDAAGVQKLKSALLDRANDVAKSSGGTFGLGSRVSGAEAAMLGKLERAFAAPKAK